MPLILKSLQIVCLFKVGSLMEHVDFWSNSICASDFIINTIVEGYRIPFFDSPIKNFFFLITFIWLQHF